MVKSSRNRSTSWAASVCWQLHIFRRKRTWFQKFEFHSAKRKMSSLLLLHLLSLSIARFFSKSTVLTASSVLFLPKNQKWRTLRRVLRSTSPRFHRTRFQLKENRNSKRPDHPQMGLRAIQWSRISWIRHWTTFQGATWLKTKGYLDRTVRIVSHAKAIVPVLDQIFPSLMTKVSNQTRHP